MSKMKPPTVKDFFTISAGILQKCKKGIRQVKKKGTSTVIKSLQVPRRISYDEMLGRQAGLFNVTRPAYLSSFDGVPLDRNTFTMENFVKEKRKTTAARIYIVEDLSTTDCELSESDVPDVPSDASSGRASSSDVGESHPSTLPVGNRTVVIPQLYNPSGNITHVVTHDLPQVLGLDTEVTDAAVETPAEPKPPKPVEEVVTHDLPHDLTLSPGANVTDPANDTLPLKYLEQIEESAKEVLRKEIEDNLAKQQPFKVVTGTSFELKNTALMYSRCPLICAFVSALRHAAPEKQSIPQVFSNHGPFYVLTIKQLEEYGSFKRELKGSDCQVVLDDGTWKAFAKTMRINVVESTTENMEEGFNVLKVSGRDGKAYMTWRENIKGVITQSEYGQMTIF